MAARDGGDEDEDPEEDEDEDVDTNEDEGDEDAGYKPLDIDDDEPMPEASSSVQPGQVTPSQNDTINELIQMDIPDGNIATEENHDSDFHSAEENSHLTPTLLDKKDEEEKKD